MMRTISVGLVACLGLALWSQPMDKDDLSSLSREQLQQLREQLKEQEMQLLRICLQEEEKAGKAFEEYEKRSLLQTDLPQPSLADRMMLVRIVGIRRVDEEVRRVEPEVPVEFPYYELQAQLVKVWYEHLRVRDAQDIDLFLKQGDTLRLLWMGCKKVGADMRASDIIWEVNKRYLVSICFFPKWPSEDSDAWREFARQPRVDKVWWLIQSTECFTYFSRYPLLIRSIVRVEDTDRLLDTPTRPVMRIEEPFKEQVRVLDEEAAYYRLPKPEQRIQWAKQRIQNTQLPLWKRQRALIYLYLAHDPDYLEETQQRQLRASLRQQYPDEKPDVVYWRFRSRRVIDYLTYLKALSEPLLQAFGLRIVKEYGGLYSKAPADEIERWLKVVEPFLEADRPPKVRREAAALLAAELRSVSFPSTEGSYWVRASEADWAWLRSYAEVLRDRWEREQDKVVRVYLARAWTGLLSVEVHSQSWPVEQRLYELGWRGP